VKGEARPDAVLDERAREPRSEVTVTASTGSSAIGVSFIDLKDGSRAV
jgi:hypothetical protein